MASQAARCAPPGVFFSFPFHASHSSAQITVTVAGLDMATATPQDLSSALISIEQAAAAPLDARCAQMEARLRRAELEAAAARLSSPSSNEVLPYILPSFLLPCRPPVT